MAAPARWETHCCWIRAFRGLAKGDNEVRSFVGVCVLMAGAAAEASPLTMICKKSMKRFHAALAACALASPAGAMDYSYRLDGQRSYVIDASGPIEEHEGEHMMAWLASLPRDIKARHIAAFIFNSPGGSVPGAWDLWNNLWPTVVTGVAAGGTCASACVIVWAKGARKYAAPDSRIGVHGSSVPATVDNSGMIADFFDANIGRYLAERGAPASVIGHLMITPPSEIYWLTPQELADWGVHITP